MSNYHLRNADYKLPNPIPNYPLGHYYLSIANYLLPFFHFQIQRGGKRCDPNSMDASGVDSPQQVSLLKPCLSICIFLVFLPYIQLDEIDPPQQVGILHLKYNTQKISIETSLLETVAESIKLVEGSRTPSTTSFYQFPVPQILNKDLFQHHNQKMSQKPNY